MRAATSWRAGRGAAQPRYITAFPGCAYRAMIGKRSRIVCVNMAANHLGSTCEVKRLLRSCWQDIRPPAFAFADLLVQQNPSRRRRERRLLAVLLHQQHLGVLAGGNL